MITPNRLKSLCFAALGTGAFVLLDFPLPFLIGPIAGCLFAALAGAKLQTMGRVGIFMRAILGVAIGCSVDPELVSQMEEMVLSLLFVPIFLLLAGSVGFLYFRFIGFDKPTSYYAAMPGGFQDMLIFGEDAGGNVRALSLIHATRVLLLLVLAPFAISQIWGIDLTGGTSTFGSEVPVHEIAIMLLAAILGWKIAERLKISGGSILGPMLLTMLLSLSGVINSRPPIEMLLAAQFFIGLAVGVRYTGVTVAEIRHVIVSALGYCFLIGSLSLGVVSIVVGTLGVVPIDALLAFLPGGQAEMAVIAIVAGADVAFVVSHHIARFMLVLLFSQVVAKAVLK